ncbi:DNA cytosine methyltransferase [Marinicella marina]|uniref:DNA cytosine methyltransferase n=1 Tax=Marinicella marina TaxID=2996016 RepID=UPI0024BD0FF0|nr:DNA cytosine methyltransferase [Marinicella marina]MDJ1139643.1 DNA cytosine methyltransferase [Marinicella marina]
MNVLSLFDGMSCGQIAFDQLGIQVDNYYASEIDKYAIQICKKNYPNTKHLGDVTDWREWNINWSTIDILIGGSPCQGFSNAGKGLAFNDPRSKLFFVYVDILNHIKKVNPKIIFLLENVSMKKEYLSIISQYLNVEPIKIDSALVSAQRRVRYYWTNMEGVTQPIDQGIQLPDILEDGEADRDKSYCLDANYFKGTTVQQYIKKCRRQIVWTIPEATKKGHVTVTEGDCIDLTFIKSKTRRGRLMIEKSNCLTASSQTYCKVTKDWFRKLTPIECERLQTVPDNYTEGVSNTQRYKMLGNGWTVAVIRHLFWEGLICVN